MLKTLLIHIFPYFSTNICQCHQLTFFQSIVPLCTCIRHALYTVCIYTGCCLAAPGPDIVTPYWENSCSVSLSPLGRKRALWALMRIEKVVEGGRGCPSFSNVLHTLPTSGFVGHCPEGQIFIITTPIYAGDLSVHIDTVAAYIYYYCVVRIVYGASLPV
jgi:hypothetical protein